MNDHEKDRIAAAFNQLRPDWPIKSIRTLLDRPELAVRPRRDVTVALGWVACEANTHTPARVLEAGPWWRAAAVDGQQANHPERLDRSERCGICGKSEERCKATEEAMRSRWAHPELSPDAVITHEFRPDYRPDRGAPRPAHLLPVVSPTEGTP